MKWDTFFLKIAVVMMSIPVIALCVFALPNLPGEIAGAFPKIAVIGYPAVIGLYATALVYFFALYQTLKLLGYIDKNEAFSGLSVEALKKIKYCAITISGLYVFELPFFYIVAEVDDAPGLVLIGMVMVFAPMVVAVFAAVLQKLLKNAIDIKSENDLTV